MTQSGYIVGFIIVAFLVYITLRGELPIYAGLLLLSPPAQPASGSASSGSAGSAAAGSTSGQAAAAASNTAVATNAVLSLFG